MKKVYAIIVACIVAFFCLLQGSSFVIGWNKYVLLAMRIMYTIIVIIVCAAWGATLVTEEKVEK